MARPKKTAASAVPEFAFFTVLTHFVQQQRKTLRREHYSPLAKKILDFNDPAKGNAYLRPPQFEALEMYIFLKEATGNASLHHVFADWRQRQGLFSAAAPAPLPSGSVQDNFFAELDLTQPEHYQAVFNQLAARSRLYPNFVYALTMGTGKTLLMAVCIFYDFLFAHHHPDDPRGCLNALVFAPDKTVLQSLREIQTFPLAKIIPEPYAGFLAAHLRVHFLDESGAGLSTLDGSRFNVIIANTQKIILKKQHQEKSASDKLFQHDAPPPGTVYAQFAGLYGDDEAPEDEQQLTINARFQRLARLPQLGIYVDEAHHALGAGLAKDLGYDAKAKTSLRLTIDELAAQLKAVGSRVVACYNYTGTPYIGDRIMPEVVYAYGLKDAITKGFLKQTHFYAYDNIKSEDFVRAAIREFWNHESERRHEGMLPKLAFFAATIEELQTDLRPAVERVLVELGIDTAKVLENHEQTSNDEVREFYRLDTPESNKQFILLVNKGREGWNCRSLFGVALYRKPKSRIFVLQASMRCLRAIGPVQETGRIYLSPDNLTILQEELQQNFRVTTADLQSSAGPARKNYTVKMVPPPVKVKIKRVQKLHTVHRKEPPEGLDFQLDQPETLEPFRSTVTEADSLQNLAHAEKRDISAQRRQRTYSAYTLVAEIGRYFNNTEVSCSTVQTVLEQSHEGMARIVEVVNQFNAVIHVILIPKLFAALYEIKDFRHETEDEVYLVRRDLPKNARGEVEFEFKAAEKLVIGRDHFSAANYQAKSFHLDPYCFDSQPERDFFAKVLASALAEKIYFTGMLTHGQSEFFVPYIDPESHTVRHYYPDFLIQTADGRWIIVEIKNDAEIDDNVVQAKAESARQLADASHFQYYLVRSTTASQGWGALR